MLNKEELLNAVDKFVVEQAQLLGLQPATIKNRKNSLKRYLEFASERAFTTQTVKAYCSFLFDKNWSPSSIKQELKVLRAFCGYLYKEKIIPDHFLKDLPMPKVKRLMKNFISERDAEKAIVIGTEIKRDDNKLARHTKKEMRLALQFMLRTGIRISEAIKLRGEDLMLDGEQPFYYVTSKGGDYEPIPMPADFVDILRERVKRERVFEITSAGCNRAFKRGCEALSLPKQTNHSLRHIYTLSRLRKGESLHLVSKTLRHSSVSMTDDYYSNYVLTDLVPVVNNSDVIRSGVPISERLEGIIKALKRTGIENDKRLSLSYTKADNELVIKICEVREETKAQPLPD